ncbi:hypothetical protein [Rhodoferax ferrireducens]
MFGLILHSGYYTAFMTPAARHPVKKGFVPPRWRQQRRMARSVRGHTHTA